MDFLPDEQTLSFWLIHYGSFVLFVLLALGIIAFPVPEETLLVLSGALMHSGHLPIPQTIMAAFGGSLVGITGSYLIGKTAGDYIMKREGKWIDSWKKHLHKAHYWFERFGKWSLFVGYFIIGVRHFTGLTAGMSRLDFKSFALYAYTGAFFWISTFLAIGYFFGRYGFEFYHNLELSDQTALLLVVLVAILYGIYVFLKSRRRSE
jgi:membrane protein DedA with SNARE-associated domain